ncbi:MAG: hypothetical protein IJS55_03365 [Oscillospiraceae bacterium]|nr:hypothetical protein [Oscillospiraceae bacterium]
MAKYLKDLTPAPEEKTAAGKTATVFDNQVKVDKLAARTAVREAKKAGENPFKAAATATKPVSGMALREAKMAMGNPVNELEKADRLAAQMAVREAKKAGENPFATAVKEQKTDKSGSFNLGTAAKAAAGGIVTGMASIAGTGAMVEDVLGGALDKVFQGAGFKGSGIFNTLYNGDTALAKALGLKGIKSEAEYYRNMAAENAKKISTGNDTIDNILKKAAMSGQDVAYGVGAAAPMAATAMFSAPAEAAAGLAEVGKNGLIRKGAEVVERSGVLQTLGGQARKLLTSRDYWTAFAQEVGQDYYEALGDGATEDQALTYAVLTSLANAGIEVGGGIQNTTQPIWKSAIEEGREEVEQGPIQRLMQNAVYGKGNPFLSVKNENAVINPVTALKEFGMGAAVGGILGTGQKAIGAAANRVADSLAAESQSTVGEVTENREESRAQENPFVRAKQQRQIDHTSDIATQRSAVAYDEGSTSVNDNPADHTAEEQRTIEAFKSAVDPNLVAFYQQAKEKTVAKKNEKPFEMKPVSERATEDIRSLTGVDTTGFRTYFETRQANHIYKDHGENGDTDHTMADDNDVGRMQFVLDHYDSVVYGGRTNSHVQMGKDGNNHPAKTVCFSKKVNGTYFVVEAVPDTKAKAVNVVSAYMIGEGKQPYGRNKKKGGAAQQFPDAQKPQGNGLTAAVDATPMNSVPQSTEKVNQKGMSFSAADRQDQGQQAAGRGFDELARETAPAEDAYMDALAQDENAPGQQRYTVGDAVRDFRARLLTQQEAPVEVEREAPPTAEDMADLVDLFADVANPIGTREDRIRDTENMVTDHTVVQKASAKQRAENAWSYFVRKMVDAGHSVTKVGQAVNDPYLYAMYNQARASASAGTNMINGEQTDVLGRNVGKSLNDIFGPIRAKGEDYYQAFQLYLFDLHNVDRMSLSQNKEELVIEAQKALAAFDEDNPDIRTTTEAQLMRLAESTDEQVAELAKERIRLIRELNKVEAIRDKPVFGYEVTAEDSRERARRALEQHPEFTEYQQQVRKYIDNLMQYRVDSGLMSAEDAVFLKRFYPNYVPTMRVGSKSTGAGRNLNIVRMGKTVGRAVGGNENLVALHEALGRQTMKVVREGSKNRFAAQMLTDYLDHGDGTTVNRYIQDATEYESDFSLDSIDNTDEEPLKKDKTVTAYLDGKMWEMKVDDSLFEAMKALSPDAQEVNVLKKVIRSANNFFKGLVTGYNPFFLVRNTVRDLQTAGLYTRDSVAFAKNYPSAIREIAQEGEYWRLYKAMGGVYSSVFDYATGTTKEPTTKAGRFMARVEALNMATEQAPRLAEFMSVIKKAEANGEVTQKVLADALYAAADVTVNFGRSGTLGKLLNANFVPFLNPGIQGFDKMVRRVTETRGAKEWAKLAVRATLLGIAPSLLNRLLYRDDDEWEQLRDSDKDTNYMFKLGNGIWLKIPKGRELSVLGITASRITDLAQGSKVDWQDYIATIGNQVAPANPLKSNIASAIVDSRLFDASDPGRTWYGGNIESQRLQSYAPGQRYDSSTDVISKAVGGALNVSPAKLNYILDQYTGVVGDIVLPLLTPQAERDPFSKAFTVDVKTNNRVGNDFYAERDELTYAKNGGDQAAAVVSRFWARQASSCSEIWKEIREVETSKLSDKEKRRQTRELKAAVTTIQANALEVEETYRKAAERYVAAGLDTDEAYREANRECFGAEYALEAYNKDVYARAQNAYKNGVGYDAFYDYYFATKGMKATDGVSKATQQFQYLQSSGLNLTAQAEIYYADIAADSTLAKQAELETNSGITAEEYYQYKAASSGMTRKEEKLAAIDGLDISDSKKDAIYLSEGYAESKIGEAPWRGGVLASPGVTESTSGNPFLAAIQRQRQQQGSGGTPRTGVSSVGGNPFLRAAAPSGGNPFLRAAAASGGNPFLRRP